MKTNFTAQKNLVLTSEENKIMAIISVPAGKYDLSEKLEQAICQDLDCESVKFYDTDKEFSEFDYEIDIQTKIYSENECDHKETFTLTLAEIY